MLYFQGKCAQVDIPEAGDPPFTQRVRPRQRRSLETQGVQYETNRQICVRLSADQSGRVHPAGVQPAPR